MKKKNLVFPLMVISLVSGFLLSGCKEQKQTDSRSFQTIKVEEEASLLPESNESPTCKINIAYSYLTENSTTDTLAIQINEAAAIQSLGKQYAGLSPAAAVDSFKNNYIATYRKEIGEFFREDLKRATSDEDVPSWYNYEYGLTTDFANGKDGILNYSCEIFEYTGGAHPNTWIKWLNFDKEKGRILTLKDVFLAGYEKPVSALLLNELIAQMSKELDNPEIKSLEDLQDAGILDSPQSMYVPENFLLKKDSISFLYNRYDIAPYSFGAITLSLPYTSVEAYMTH